MVRDVARKVADAHPDLPVSDEVVVGPAVDTLVAEAAGARALVLGSRGHGAVVGFLLGSVGQQVIAEYGCPVVLVRADDRAAPGRRAGRSSWVSRASPRTARPPWSSRSRRRRSVAPGYARYVPGVCRRCSPTARVH